MDKSDVNPGYGREGLNESEVQKRAEAGQSNHDAGPESRSYGQIIRDNVLTFFNLFNLALAAAVVVFAIFDPELWPNIAFMGVVFWNAGLGIIQEIRAKIVVDRLNILTQSEVVVLRSGREREIKTTELVVDDLMILTRGDEVSVDAVVLETSGLEVDESLLTGESGAVLKHAGDELFSGSVILAGECKSRAVKVGLNTFAKVISIEAKKEVKQESMLVAELDRLVRGIAKIIVPLGVLLLLNGIFIDRTLELDAVVVTTVSNLVSMIPEGLVLLTTIALAVSVVKLARRNTMAQTLSGIESLARVDVLCLDKTGTITTGDIDVLEIISLDNQVGQAEVEEALLNLSRVFHRSGISATQDALNRYTEHFHDRDDSGQKPWRVTDTVPFSSDRKWEAATFEDQGFYVIGAPELVFRDQMLSTTTYKNIEQHAGKGRRVLILARGDRSINQLKDGDDDRAELPQNLEPLALVLLGDQIRADAFETLRYFREQAVALKVISGDHPLTTASVAARVGVADSNESVDMSMVADDADYRKLVKDHAVFGRVSPFQKRRLIAALQELGHQVAMTGDGVNDVLALKSANCSIAMASGSDAARTVADLVLLDNNLSSLVAAVDEGRRVINNIQRVATLFLVKTFYATVMAFVMLILPLNYPLYPIQATLINSLTVGIPAFVLALKPNRERVSGTFLANVLPRITAPGLSIVLSWILIQIVAGLRGWDYDLLSTLSLFTVGTVGLVVLFRVSIPYDPIRITVIALCIGGFVSALLFLPGILQTLPITVPLVLLSLPFVGAALTIFYFLSRLVNFMLAKGYWAAFMSGLGRIVRLR